FIFCVRCRIMSFSVGGRVIIIQTVQRGRMKTTVVSCMFHLLYLSKTSCRDLQSKYFYQGLQFTVPGKSYMQVVELTLSACGCSFEDGLCVWVQGAEDRLDWLSNSGPTGTPNTGPAGDHTTGKGKYLYIESSPPSIRGYTAQLKSPMLPPAGENGYCFTFWHHMFGATVGSLRMLLQTTDPMKKTMWQKSGNQGDEWQRVQIHVSLQEVHQVILDAAVGGEAGDIAIDDISLTSGPCPTQSHELWGVHLWCYSV
uniref:MAM domain-containing protein n=1 Tax=Mola mola TaxID=94237 RepID=A0A3Q3W735_MOLML